MTTRVAYVHMHLGGSFVVAGRLRYVQDGRFSQCFFEYSNRYLERPDAVAVDPVEPSGAARNGAGVESSGVDPACINKTRVGSQLFWSVGCSE